MDRLESSLVVVAGLAAAALQALGFLLIAMAMLRGEARPNRYSWLIWSVVATLAAASSWQAGATWPLAGAAMNALGCVLIWRWRYVMAPAGATPSTRPASPSPGPAWRCGC